MYQKYLFLILMLLGALLNAQETQKIKVRGNCGSCKVRIEKAVTDLPSATGSWDIKTKVLEVSYDPTQTSLQAIMKHIAEVGHDNEMYLADDSVYKGLPACCLYDREISWDDIHNSKGTHGVEEDHNHSDSHHHEGHGENMPKEDSLDFDSSIPEEDETVVLTTANVAGRKPASAFDKNAVGLQENL